MGDGQGERRFLPSLGSPCSPEWGSKMINTGAPLSSMGIVTPSLPTRLPSRRVLKSKRILPGEMKFPLFLINP